MNIYYDPEKLGLSVFAEIEFSDMSYEYDTLVILKRGDDGALFYAEDSGCSCPVPFEDWTLTELFQQPITKATFADFAKYVEKRHVEDGYSENYQDVFHAVYQHLYGGGAAYITEDEKWGG